MSLAVTLMLPVSKQVVIDSVVEVAKVLLEYGRTFSVDYVLAQICGGTEFE